MDIGNVFEITRSLPWSGTAVLVNKESKMTNREQGAIQINNVLLMMTTYNSMTKNYSKMPGNSSGCGEIHSSVAELLRESN